MVIPALAAALVAASGVVAAVDNGGGQRFVLTAKTVNGKDGPLRVVGRGVIDARGTFQIADERRTSSGVFRFPQGTLRIVFTGR